MVSDRHIIHWNHTNILKYENRPENFKDLIIENCKNMISSEDDIYHLGDVIFKQKAELKEILSIIPGTKHMCKGNHDHEKPIWYISKGFKTCQKYIIIDNILLSHHPLDIDLIENETGIKIDFNIHGHFHRMTREDETRTKIGYPFYSDRHINLSIEEMEYKPILINEFLNLKGKI